MNQTIFFSFRGVDGRKPAENVKPLTWTKGQAAPQFGEKLVHDGRMWKVLERTFQSDRIDIIVTFVRPMPQEGEKS
jgi:hypothetical protein